jgi:hypothetical protein
MSFLQAVYEESFWLTSTSYKIEYATRELAYEVEAMPRPSGAYSLGDRVAWGLLEASRGRLYHAVDQYGRPDDSVAAIGEHLLLLADAPIEPR